MIAYISIGLVILFLIILIIVAKVSDEDDMQNRDED